MLGLTAGPDSHFYSLTRIRLQHHKSQTAVGDMRAAAQRYMIYYEKLTPTVYTHVGESGVTLTIRYLKRLGTE